MQNHLDAQFLHACLQRGEADLAVALHRMAVARIDERARDGRFLAVGDDAAIAAHIGPNTQVVELAGKTVVPGLIDSHLHQLSAGLNGPAVQLLGFEAVSSGLADMYHASEITWAGRSAAFSYFCNVPFGFTPNEINA
jgi:cytosine/adenosine deaminase-related metal-dependent hydrolase